MVYYTSYYYILVIALHIIYTIPDSIVVKFFKTINDTLFIIGIVYLYISLAICFLYLYKKCVSQFNPFTSEHRMCSDRFRCRF